MSEWITDRRPTAEDAPYNNWVMVLRPVNIQGNAGNLMGVCDYQDVGDLPWRHFGMGQWPSKAVHMGPRFAVQYFVSGPWYRVRDTKIGKTVAKRITSRETAERIAAIYEEVMP